MWPITLTPGSTAGHVNNAWRKGHRGLDLRAKTGTPVRAVAPGRVRALITNPTAGCFLQVEHNAGGAPWWTEYLHLSAYAVDRGENVIDGQTLALSGNSGSASTGPHLHFQVRVSAAWLRLFSEELKLRRGIDYVSGGKGGGFMLNPLRLLDVPAGAIVATVDVDAGETDGAELELLAVADPVDRDVTTPLLEEDVATDVDVAGFWVDGLDGPSPLRIKKWCEWQGKKAAAEFLVAGGLLALALGLVRT